MITLLFFLAQTVIQGTTLGFPTNALTVVKSASLNSLKQNIAASGSFFCSGGSGTGYTISNTGSFPAGLSGSILGGTITVSGTPTGTSAATVNVTCTDSLGHSTGAVPFTLTPASLTPPLGPISSAFLPASVTVGGTLTPPNNSCPSTWSDGSSLDLTLIATWTSSATGVATIGTNTGVITGVSGGTSNITCAFNSTTSAAAVVTVSSSTVVVTTTQFPPNKGGNGTAQAQIYQAFPAFQLQASGGTPPYTWAVSSGSLPTGFPALPSSGVVTGTPTASGTFTFSVIATDSASHSSAPQSLTIVVASLSSIAVSPASATMVSGTTLQLAATGTYSDTSTADVTNVSGTSTGALQFINTPCPASGSACTSGNSSVTSVATPAFSMSAGNFLAVWVASLNQSTSPTFTVADAACGDTFTATTQQTTTGFHGEIFYAMNIAGGNCAVTCTSTVSLQRFNCTPVQYSGAATTSALDVENHAGNGSGNVCSASLTTTNANDLLVGGCIANEGQTGTFTAGSGYTLRNQDGESAYADQIVSATSTYTPTINFGGSPATWLSNSAAFKAAASGGSMWSSSNNAAATVNSSGLVTALTVSGNTSVTITITLGAVNGTSSITVTPAAVTQITLSPLSPSVPQNGTVQFTATCTFQGGGTGNCTNNVTWGSNPTSCATITTGGLATAVSGTACTSTISATSH